jgi:hypothetical protein
MTNLTEQWKKGELLCGWYWVKMSYQGAIILLYYSEDYGFEYDGHFYDFEEISEVLGRVPNYELWKAVHEQWKVLLDENTKLKELLKGAKEVIEWYKADCGYRDIPTEVTLQHINQVLGEE